MSNPALMLEQQLNALREAYAQQLPDKMKQLEQTWRLLILGQWTTEGFKALYRQVHGLAGSGATFGYARVTDTARAVELYIKPLLDQEPMPCDADLLKINALLGELRKVCAQPDQSAPQGERVGKLHQFIPARRN